jgi:hypothetical protein
MFLRLWFKFPAPPFFLLFPVEPSQKGPKGTKNIENKSLERLKITKGDSRPLWA